MTAPFIFFLVPNVLPASYNFFENTIHHPDWAGDGSD
jgi:hypothetical protein